MKRAYKDFVDQFDALTDADVRWTPYSEEVLTDADVRWTPYSEEVVATYAPQGLSSLCF
jgi:hypothetical protein